MPQTTLTFRVDTDLKKEFADAAKADERTPAQLLRIFMRETVQRTRDAREHDAWFRMEAQMGMLEAKDPDIKRIPHEEVRADWHRQRAEIAKRGRDSQA